MNNPVTDTERLDWMIANAPYIPLHGNRCSRIVLSDNTRKAIDEAMTLADALAKAPKARTK